MPRTPLPRTRPTRELARAILAIAILVGASAGLAVMAGATGATPSYPTISGPSTGSGGVAVAVTVGDFTLADATASGSACGISAFRAVMTTDLGTINMSSAGGATVSGNRSTSVTVSGTRAQVEAALDSATVTAASAGTATVTTTFRPADTFTAGGNDYVFSTANGHYYRRDNNGSDVSWATARTHAAAQSFCGADGYLATITSADENSAGVQFLSAYTRVPYWIGGVRASDASDPAGTACTTAGCNWYWDPGTNAPSGEQRALFSSFSYGDTANVSPWFSNQPDGSGPSLVISWGRVAEATDAYRWDDVPVAQSGVSYGLAEFGNNTSYSIASQTTTLTLTRPDCAQATTYKSNVAYFTATGAGCTGSWTRPNADITGVTLIFVGGGGGGGYQGGGGGSGGGLISLGFPGNSYSITGSPYAITIGGGGAGASSLDPTGASGTSTTFGSFTAIGGAGGGSRDNAGASGPSGGGAGSSTSSLSGGAASYNTDTGNPSSLGAGVNSSATYGLVGAANNTSYPLFGGGGGGAYGNAATAPNDSANAGLPGRGGAGYGISSMPTGIPLLPYDSTTVTWGTGGGGGRDDSGTTYSTASLGAGGGGGGGGGRAGQAGFANSGNGGGGGGRVSAGYGAGGNGAAGMVFIRYDVTPAWRTGSTVYDGQAPDAYTFTDSVTFQDSGDTVTLTNHRLANGTIVRFTSISSTTGISTNTTYYVVNATTNTLQVASSVGGSALALTTNGSGTMVADGTVNDLAFGRVGASYSQFAFVQKGVGESVDDWTYSVSSGSLPPGLTLTEVGLRKVEISGTPTTAGTYSFSLTAADSETETTNAVYSFRIAITGVTQPSLAFAWPLATSITIPGPSDLAGGLYAGVCLYASDASGTASGSLRFDVGTKGTAQTTVSAGTGTITVTNDYAYGSMFLGGTTTANVLALLNQPDAITITRSDFRSTFYFTVRYVPYVPRASVSCATAIGTTGVQQVVEVRSLGASFVDQIPVTLD